MSEDRALVPCYIARCKCGCGGLVFASIDEPQFTKETAKSVADIIKRGYAVERTTLGEVNSMKWRCQKPDVQPALL